MIFGSGLPVASHFITVAGSPSSITFTLGKVITGGKARGCVGCVVGGGVVALKWVVIQNEIYIIFRVCISNEHSFSMN